MSEGSPTRKRRLLVMNQYYWPGLEATAVLLSQLCEGLADEFEITVITGMLYGVEAEAGSFTHNSVRIVRVRSTSMDRSKPLQRAVNYVTYLVQSLLASVKDRRPDAVVCMTDPPIIADVALLVARCFRVPLLVISQDVFPEIAVELRRLENPVVVGLLRWLIRFYLKRADHVVAIGETMRGRLIEKGASADRISVIPNWADSGAIEPMPKENPWSVAEQLADRFVVMHSGNIGHAQDLDTLVRATTFLRDLDRLTVAVIGSGARAAALGELAARLDADAVKFWPYQERSALSLTLSSADVHVVGLAAGLAGFVVPSRLYGILSAGRPVIVAADETSETAQIVRRIGCGVVVAPGHPELLAHAIRAAHDGELDLAGMGARGREWLVSEARREIAIERYRDLLRAITGGRG